MMKTVASEAGQARSILLFPGKHLKKHSKTLSLLVHCNESGVSVTKLHGDDVLTRGT